MLKSEIINELFNNIAAHRGFNNPFTGNNTKEIFNQINNIKYYVNFPLFQINGRTFKLLGIILINKKFKKTEDTNKYNKFIKYIINTSSKKSNECHEIIANYMSVMCRTNEYVYKMLISDNNFINYPSKYDCYFSDDDGGNKLESVLFDNKILYLSFQSSIYILDEHSWSNKSIEKFREEIMKCNELKEIKTDLSKIKSIELIKLIIENFKLNLDDIEINISKSNNYILFREGSMKLVEDELIIDEEDFDSYGRLSLNSNYFLPKKESISKIIKAYGLNK